MSFADPFAFVSFVVLSFAPLREHFVFWIFPSSFSLGEENYVDQ
jgi:hypothetical protein